MAEKEQRELEQRGEEKGKGRAREDMLEVGPSQPRKQRAELEGEGQSTKKLKVSGFLC